MRTQTTYDTDTHVKLTIVADAESLQQIKDETLEALRSSVKIQGFRSGKAPLAMVERSLDQNVLQSEFLERAVNDLFVAGVNQEKLRSVTQPEINIKKFVPFTTLEVEAEFDVLGAVTLPKYKTFTLAKSKPTVSAKDVTDVLERLQTQNAEKKAVKRVAKIGDETVIDFFGTDIEKDEPLQGGAGDDYPLVLGSNSFIPGFEDNLVGLKAGEDKTFTITFPADYGVAALQGRDVSFKVTVRAVNDLVKPKLDDAFAAKLGPFKTLAELKADVKQQLLAEKEAQAERDYDNDLIAALAKQTTLSVPAQIVDQELDGMERDERQNLAYRGQTWEEHLKEEGVSEEEHRERNRQPAEERVKAGIMLAEIAEAEKITVSEDDISARITLMKSQYSDAQMQAELDKPENRRSIASRIMTEKTIAKLRQYAEK